LNSTSKTVKKNQTQYFNVRRIFAWHCHAQRVKIAFLHHIRVETKQTSVCEPVPRNRFALRIKNTSRITFAHVRVKARRTQVFIIVIDEL